MKQKTTNLLLVFGYLILTCSILLWSCQKEDLSFEVQETVEQKKLNVTISHWKSLEDRNALVTKKLEKLRKKNLISRNIESSAYGFVINDDHIQIIENENYTTYTFLVERDEHEEGILENYMFKEFEDGSYKQFLLAYYYSLDNLGNNTFDTSHLGIVEIDDENLVLDRNPQSGDCHPHFVRVDHGLVCTTRERCTGTPSHEIGEPCDCEVQNMSCLRAGSQVCVHNYTWEFNDCSGGNDDGHPNDPNDPNNPPTGGNTGSGGNNSNDDTTNTIPFDVRLGQFESTLETEELNWWRNFENVDEVNKLKYHLSFNNYSDLAKEYVTGSIELEMIANCKSTPYTTCITLHPQSGKINNRDEFPYTHIGTDGAKTAFKLETGELVVRSASRLMLNGSDYNYGTEFSDSKYHYIKANGQWAQLLIKDNISSLYEDLQLLFQLGALELGQFFGTYVCPIEDIKILITGKDFEGEPANRWLAAGMLLTEIVGVGKIFKVVKGALRNTRVWRVVVEEGSQLIVRTSDEIFELLTTQANKAYFWSGRLNDGTSVVDIARNIANNNGGHTLESLLDYHNIQLPVYSDETKALWDEVSRELAKRASGDVRVVLGHQINPEGVWSTIEFEALKDNLNVNKIIRVDPITLLETIFWQR